MAATALKPMTAPIAAFRLEEDVPSVGAVGLGTPPATGAEVDGRGAFKSGALVGTGKVTAGLLKRVGDKDGGGDVITPGAAVGLLIGALVGRRVSTGATTGGDVGATTGGDVGATTGGDVGATTGVEVGTAIGDLIGAGVVTSGNASEMKVIDDKFGITF